MSTTPTAPLSQPIAYAATIPPHVRAIERQLNNTDRLIRAFEAAALGAPTTREANRLLRQSHRYQARRRQLRWEYQQAAPGIAPSFFL